MSRPRKLSPESIVAAAVDLINSGETLSFSVLARKLDCRSQALYPYFEHKAALEQAIASWFIAGMNREITESCFGLQGESAMIAFAQAIRRFGLDNFQVFLLTLRITGKRPRSKELEAPVKIFREKFRTLLAQVRPDDHDARILLNRALRNYVAGEIVNVGSGWFQKPEFTAEQSFEMNLKALLRGHIDQDELN